MEGERRVVEDVPEAFVAAVRETTPRTLALSGGDTARRCYERLAEAAWEGWAETDVLIGDERWVPVDHDDSNEGMAHRVLLDKVPVRRVHSMREAGPTPQEAAVAYDELLRGYDHLDLVHLGVGEDGHTASLFPDQPGQDEQTRLAVAAESEHHEHPRVTITFPAIAKARLAVVTVEESEALDAVERIRSGADLPAGRIRAERVLWLLAKR